MVLLSFIATQCVFPLACAYAQANAPDGVQDEAAQRPRVVDHGLKIPPNAPLRKRDRRISTRMLNLAQPLTEDAISAAGGLGGPLSPLRSADTAVLAKAGGSAKQLLRLEQMNRAFAVAIIERNKRNFPRTAQLMAQYLKDYPDSPWAGEASLHLAMDAQVAPPNTDGNGWESGWGSATRMSPWIIVQVPIRQEKLPEP